MPILSCLLLGLAPALFWLWYFRRDDEGADPALSLRVFLVGAASTALLLAIRPFLASWLPNADDFATRLLRTALLVGVLEEGVKLDAFLLGAFLHRSFRGPLDGIAYGIAAGLGFATVENVYLIARTGEPNLALIRGVTATFAHVGFTGLLGFGFGVGQLKRGVPRIAWYLGSVLVAVSLHTAYAICIKPPLDLDYLAILGILPALHIALLGARRFSVRCSLESQPLSGNPTIPESRS